MFRGFNAEFGKELVYQVGGDDDAAPCQLPLFRGDNCVVNVRVDCDCKVGWQGPGGRRPDQGKFVGCVSILVKQRDADRRCLVLAILVDVVVHLQFVVRQGGFVVPAVGQHRVALIDVALVKQGLERPKGRLHVLRVKCLVVVLEVHPTRLASHVVFPFARVAQHGSLAGVVESLDADPRGSFHLGLVDNAQFTFSFKLCGQTVSVPAKAAFDAMPQLCLVAAHNVFHIAGEEVAVVGQAVREGRAVVKDELV